MLCLTDGIYLRECPTDPRVTVDTCAGNKDR